MNVIRALTTSGIFILNKNDFGLFCRHYFLQTIPQQVVLEFFGDSYVHLVTPFTFCMPAGAKKQGFGLQNF